MGRAAYFRDASYRQLGVTLCSTGLGVIAEPALAHLLATPLHAVGLGAEVAHGLAVVVALLLVVTAHVVLGEMVPKNVSISMPDKAVLIFAPALVACERVTRPAVSALNGLANVVLKLFGLEPRDEIERLSPWKKWLQLWSAHVMRACSRMTLGWWLGR